MYILARWRGSFQSDREAFLTMGSWPKGYLGGADYDGIQFVRSSYDSKAVQTETVDGVVKLWHIMEVYGTKRSRKVKQVLKYKYDYVKPIKKSELQSRAEDLHPKRLILLHPDKDYS